MQKRVEKLQKVTHRLPIWIPSFIILAAVLWLTLAPHPVGDIEVPLFPGADKAVHAIMFMVLCFAVLFDTMRYRRWTSLPLPLISAVVFGGGILGVIIEFLQRAMHGGRSFEPADMLADFTGAVFVGVIWLIYQELHLFIEEEKEKHQQ